LLLALPLNDSTCVPIPCRTGNGKWNLGVPLKLSDLKRTPVFPYETPKKIQVVAKESKKLCPPSSSGSIH